MREGSSAIEGIFCAQRREEVDFRDRDSDASKTQRIDEIEAIKAIEDGFASIALIS
jgi:hypothetical protein